MKKMFNKRNAILLSLAMFMAVSGFAVANLVNGDDDYAAIANENVTPIAKENASPIAKENVTPIVEKNVTPIVEENVATTPFWISEAKAYFVQQDDACLRFDLNMSAEQYDSLKAEGSEDWAETVEVGALLVPQKANDGLTLENTANRYIQNITLEQWQWVADNEENPQTYTAWVAVGGYEAKESRYTLDITAVGYLKTDEAEQYTDSVTSSMTEVTYNQQYVEEASDGSIVTPEWLVQYYENSISTVTFEANNGSVATQQTLINGKKVSEPTAPTVDGWTFDGWYNGEQKYDFSTQVMSDITLHAKYKQVVNVENTFEVYSTINGTTPVANNLVVTLNNTAAMSEANVYGLLNGDVVMDYSWEDDKLTVFGNTFGASVYGDVEIVVTDDNYTVIVEVSVVTKYMASYDDLNNMPYYGGIDLATTERAYDGYFVMTKDIDCNGAYFTKRNGDIAYGSGEIGTSGKDAYQYVGKCGFAGVFDGQGYAIKNAKAIHYYYGLFGNTQTGSVVKNLAVVATMDTNTDTGRVLLGNNLAGEIQNCYFDVKVGNVTLASGKHLGGALGFFISGKLTDVVVKFDTTNTPAGVQVGGLAFQLHPHPAYWENKASLENVYVFTQAEKLFTYVGDKTSLTAVKKYGYDESATATMADNTYWNMAGDQPAFKSVMPQAIKTIAYNQDFEVYSSINGTTPVANAFTLDLTAYNIPANPNSITINGERASMTVDNSCWANGVLTVADLGAKVYGDVTVEFEMDEVLYKVTSIKVVTKYLANFNDYNNMPYYGGVDVNQNGKPYDGYFVMTNNINLNDTGTLTVSSYNSANSEANGTNGFAGIFDGNGYKIYNRAFYAGRHGGIFGNVAKTGVIKNVEIECVFLALGADWQGGYIIGKYVAGTLENVYFDVSFTKSNQSTAWLIAYSLAYSNMKDVVIKLNASIGSADFSKTPTTALSVYGAYWTGSAHTQLMNLENVHVFTNIPTLQAYTAYYSGAGMPTLNVYGLDEVPATAITMTNSTYWDLSGNQPVWKDKVA